MSDLPSPVPVPGLGVAAPPISRAIYGMPMFATLLVADLDVAASWYVDGLGFISLFTLPGRSGPLLVHLRRWQCQDVLIRPASGPVSACTECSLSFAAVYGELDELATRARSRGAGRVEGPADTPWTTRDLTTIDPDGNVVIFTAARPPEHADAAFTDQMRRWSAEQYITTG